MVAVRSPPCSNTAVKLTHDYADVTGSADFIDPDGDNDTRRIDRVRLGAVAGIDTGTRGTYYFDAFESRRQTAIGP